MVQIFSLVPVHGPGPRARIGNEARSLQHIDRKQGRIESVGREGMQL